MKMKKLAVGVSTARWIDEKDHVASIKRIKKCGFEALDYQINSWFRQTLDAEKLTSFFDKSVKELCEHYTPMRDTAREEEVCFSQFHAPLPMYFPDDPIRTEYYAQVTEKMMALAAFLDCPSIVVHPWGTLKSTKEEEYEVNMKLYRRLMPAAKKYGVRICLENMFSGYLGEDGREILVPGVCADVDETCKYIDALNKEAGEELFGFCLDIGHANVAEVDIYEFIKKLDKRLIDLHLHENDGKSDTHAIPYTQECAAHPGKRPIDWELVLKGLREVGFEGALSFETQHAIEVLPEELKSDALTYIASIGKYFRKRMQEE